MEISPGAAKAAKCGCSRGKLTHVGQYGVRCHHNGRFVTGGRSCAARVKKLRRKVAHSVIKKSRRK